MNRWKTRNMINRRDVFEIKESLNSNYQMLKKINKKLDKVSKKTYEELQKILENGEAAQIEYGNIEMLLKALMVDSLLKEIGNEDDVTDQRRL